MTPASITEASTGAEVLTGIDFYPAVFDACTVAVLGLVAIPFAHAYGGSLPVLFLVTALVAALGAGARFRLTVSAEGIELVNLRAWVVPVRRTRWLLDARIDLYESLDADRPQGLCVEVGLLSHSRPSECFGPLREDAIRTLQAAASAALERQRAAAPICPPELRHARLGPQSARFDLSAATRHASGRLREARNRERVELCGIELPPGSAFRFNDAPFADSRFIDPRQDDVLVEVQVAEPVAVHGHRTRAGAVLRFPDDGSIVARDAFDGELEIDGKVARGREILSFRSDGRLEAFTLARELSIGEITLPPGSKLHHFDAIGRALPARWTCWLGAPLTLPETTLAEGDSCQLAPDLSRLVAIAPSRDLELAQGRLRGGVGSIPVTSAGRVDVAACRKRRLFV